MSNKNVIIISSIDWSTHWQMHHQLATSLVATGHRVLFIENTGVRGPQLKDFGRIVDRVRKRLSSLHGFREIEQNLWAYSPAFLPFPYNSTVNSINVSLISKSIRQWMRITRFTDPIVISFLPTPLAKGLIENIAPALTIYYCANHMAGASSATKKLRYWEDLFFKKADIIFAISEAIFERAQPFNQSIYSFPAGIDEAKFMVPGEQLVTPDDIKAIKRPIIGYVGAISDVFDQEMVAALADALPEATLVLVGPKYTNTSLIEQKSNIVLIGERSHELIPAYVSSFDVALIPYVVNEFTDSVYSCKLNEYLAMGAAVVATNMREICAYERSYPGVISMAAGTKEFIEKVKQTLDNPQFRSAEAIERRKEVARENTWTTRFNGIMTVIDKHLANKALQQPNNWKDSLQRYYTRHRVAWMTPMIVLVMLYLGIFHSPLVWFIGDQLVVRHAPLKTDAIVVFSGNGETSYRNDSYQRRALDAVHFYKQGYAPSIYLSSGRDQDISEVEVIKLYLQDKGVEPSAIHILNTYPKSTTENVQLVSQQLRNQGAHSILFLTSPYHGRRALWTWRKQAPDIAVWTPAVIDTPSASPQWSASVDQIRVIVYEYAAIVYNWLKGTL
jgi:uncharacterized SAM-binding protein YcdF (DUF218 family)/glycosyltransferase involved in cell wall biosynthesis